MNSRTLLTSFQTVYMLSICSPGCQDPLSNYTPTHFPLYSYRSLPSYHLHPTYPISLSPAKSYIWGKCTHWPNHLNGDIHSLHWTDQFHSLIHTNIKELHALFAHIPLTQFQRIITTCSFCASLVTIPALQMMGTNTQGFNSNALWKIDVTHIPQFGRNMFSSQ